MANLHINFRSDCLSRSVYPVAFLPDYNGYNDQPPPYRTLYFLPGYSGGGLETAQFTNFAFYAAQYGIAIILIDGENSFYVDDEQRGALFSRYAGQEIVEATRALLPLSHRREDTFIGGISMGGYGALINGLRYADTFSKIAMLSPALEMHRRNRENPDLAPIPLGELVGTIGTEEAMLGTYKDPLYAARKALANGAPPEIFLGCGRQDALVIGASRRFAQSMGEMGYPITAYEAEGLHDHTFWKQAMTPLCAFLTEQGGQ
ncbi:MAG: hypothetical protein LBM74_02490 [Oscillospiraceae bacterium]|jgi:S-formylglutathione hydrolase FrmB|nr:hypothetical protein [Oscillospiraceae bacterium]